MPECTWCHGGIIFRKGPDGKSHAYNLDDTPHRCKGWQGPKPEQGTIARVTEYDVSNVYLNSNLFFLPLEGRKAAQEKYPVGTVVKAIIEKGICKSINDEAARIRESIDFHESIIAEHTGPLADLKQELEELRDEVRPIREALKKWENLMIFYEAEDKAVKAEQDKCQTTLPFEGVLSCA